MTFTEIIFLIFFVHRDFFHQNADLTWFSKSSKYGITCSNFVCCLENWKYKHFLRGVCQAQWNYGGLNFIDCNKPFPMYCKGTRLYLFVIIVILIWKKLILVIPFCTPNNPVLMHWLLSCLNMFYKNPDSDTYGVSALWVNHIKPKKKNWLHNYRLPATVCPNKLLITPFHTYIIRTVLQRYFPYDEADLARSGPTLFVQ